MQTNHTTIELTSKKLKGHLVFAWFIIILGLVGMFDETSNKSGDFIFFLLSGVIYWFITKIRIWWNHS